MNRQCYDLLRVDLKIIFTLQYNIVSCFEVNYSHCKRYKLFQNSIIVLLVLKFLKIFSDRFACRRSHTGTRCWSWHECGTSFTWRCRAVRGHLSERSNRFHPGNSRFNSRRRSCHFRRRRQFAFRLVADRFNGDDATIVRGNGAKKRDSTA